MKMQISECGVAAHDRCISFINQCITCVKRGDMGIWNEKNPRLETHRSEAVHRFAHWKGRLIVVHSSAVGQNPAMRLSV